MKHTLTNEQLKEFAGLPKDFSLPVIKPHVETAFREKIHPYISADLLTDLKDSTDENRKEIADLVFKAAANYTVVVAIPFIKVKFNTSGIDQYEQEKMKTAPWWDVRDLGLASVKVADKCLSDALTAIGKISELKSQCTFFTEYSYAPIPTPEEFNKIYTINKSLDVYNLLVPIMKRIWSTAILAKIKKCTIAEISENEDLAELLKNTLVYYALANALKLSQFTFITSGVVIQYEELPWMKSLVLSDQAKNRLESEFLRIAADSLSAIINHLKDNAEDFPCYEPQTVVSAHKIIVFKGGIYI